LQTVQICARRKDPAKMWLVAERLEVTGKKEPTELCFDIRADRRNLLVQLVLPPAGGRVVLSAVLSDIAGIPWQPAV
jgi:hypothetical protein